MPWTAEPHPTNGPKELARPVHTHGATVSHSICKLLEALECIKKSFSTDKECEGTYASAKGGGSSKKKMVTFSNQIPKKHHVDVKHCLLCKQNEGMHNTHYYHEVL